MIGDLSTEVNLGTRHGNPIWSEMLIQHQFTSRPYVAGWQQNPPETRLASLFARTRAVGEAVGDFDAGGDVGVEGFLELGVDVGVLG